MRQNIGIETIHELTSEPILFLDDFIIKNISGIDRKVQFAKKRPDPVLMPENEWEMGLENGSRRVNLYGTTMFDKILGRFRMWYMCRMGPTNNRIPGLFLPPSNSPPIDKYGRKVSGNDRGDLTCYAESDDGYVWSRPSIRLFEFNGSQENNIVWDFHGASVFRDDNEKDEERRFKALGYCQRYRNIFLVSSPDGIRWDDSNWVNPITTRGLEGPHNVVFDNKYKKYRAYSTFRDSKIDPSITDKQFIDDPHRTRRMIYYSESNNLQGEWSNLAPMLKANSADDEVAKNKYGGKRAEIYYMSGFRYGNIYIGLVGMLYVTGPASKDMPPATIDGPIEVLLVYSRDGIKWNYFNEERTPIIPRGEKGTFDSGMILGVAKEPVIHNNKIMWYYTGTRHTHGASLMGRLTCVGCAVWEQDRFACLQDSRGDGIVETRILTFIGSNIEINADASAGCIKAEILSPNGEVQSGFSKNDFTPIVTNSLSHKLSWKEKSLFQILQPMIIRLYLTNAKLFAIRSN